MCPRKSKSSFVRKLWIFVNDPKWDVLIAWSDSGDSFIIKDEARFANELLPQYFKHKNMASFIRQLNNYGFKKVTDIEKSGLQKQSDEMEFRHEFDYFIEDGEELLELIESNRVTKPNVPDTKPKVPKAPSNINAKDTLRHSTSTQETQENMYNMVLKMNKEIEILSKELIAMRQKQKEQEMLIQIVVHFLIPKVQKSGNQNLGFGMLRKISRMIHDNPKTSSSQVSRASDVIQNKNPECVGSPLAPVKHERTDNVPTVANHRLVSILKSPAVIHVAESPASQDENDGSSQLKHPFVKTSSKQITLRKLAANNLNVPMEQLGILEALWQRSPAASRDEINQNESILGIPLDYIIDQANTEEESVISMPKDGTVCNVISIPEDGTMCNVISVPEDKDIGNVISLPEGNSISDVIPISTINNIIDKEITTSNPATPLANPIDNRFTSSEFFNSSDLALFSELQPSMLNENNSKCLQLTLSKNDFNDNLLLESLPTPKIVTSDEDACNSTREPKTEWIKKGEISKASTPQSSNLVKNALTNHLPSVKEKLNYVQDQLADTPCDLDVYNLLRLFSSDGVANINPFSSSLFDGVHIKDEKNEIRGNEIVPFSPNMQKVDFFLSEALKQDAEILSSDLNYLSELLLDVLKETPSETANFITNQASTNNTSSKRKVSSSRTSKNKRCKGRLKSKDFI